MIDSNSCTAFTVVSAFSTPYEETNESKQQIGGPREYRIQDVWGDDPVEIPVISPEAVLTLPASSALKQSWTRRLLIRLFGPLLIEPTDTVEHLSGKASTSDTGLLRTTNEFR